MTRAQKWAAYGAAWLPMYFAYMQLLVRVNNRPLAEAAVSSLIYTTTAALLGVLVWWGSARVVWPDVRFLRFISLQIFFAFAFSAFWDTIIVGSIAVRTGIPTALQIARTFVGWQFLSGLWLYAVLAAISHTLRVSSRLREREAAAAKAETLRVRAELQALRGQLNPHFLFNTLHTVSALVQRDPATAQVTLERFAGLLRYVLNDKRLERDDVRLGDELEFVRDYLALEKLRLGDRLVVVEEIDPEALDVLIPSLALQPLVENAIAHAVSARRDPTTVCISARVDDEELRVQIADDGPGTALPVESSHGIGLRVSRQRLETRYAGRATFGVETGAGKGFAVKLAVPMQFRTTARHAAPA